MTALDLARKKQYNDIVKIISTCTHNPQPRGELEAIGGRTALTFAHKGQQRPKKRLVYVRLRVPSLHTA